MLGIYIDSQGKTHSLNNSGAPTVSKGAANPSEWYKKYQACKKCEMTITYKKDGANVKKHKRTPGTEVTIEDFNNLALSDAEIEVNCNPGSTCDKKSCSLYTITHIKGPGNTGELTKFNNTITNLASIKTDNGHFFFCKCDKPPEKAVEPPKAAEQPKTDVPKSKKGSSFTGKPPAYSLPIPPSMTPQ